MPTFYSGNRAGINMQQQQSMKFTAKDQLFQVKADKKLPEKTEINDRQSLIWKCSAVTYVLVSF